MDLQGAAGGPTGRPFNGLLGRLSDSDFALLEPHLEYASCAPNEVLYHPGDEVNIAHFPCGPSLTAFVVPVEDGRDVETILVGREGAVGGIVSQGFLPAYSRIVVKFGGPFVRIQLQRLQWAKDKSPALHGLFARYADCLVAQFAQSIGCNAVHSIQQRAAKWIIATMERTGQDLVPLTHGGLAAMLGVGRTYASRIIAELKAERILDTGRGAIHVRNLAELRKRSCRCNEAVNSHFEAVFSSLYSESSPDR